MEPRTTQILLIRHGQTDANAGGVLQGHQPTPLNLQGVHQATLLAARLKALHPPIDLLVSSDLPRATQTASPIATACGINMVTDPAWRERSFGLLEGKPVGDRELWRMASGDVDPPGAEPMSELYDRVHGALAQLPVRYPNASVIAVVTHGGPVRSVLKMLAVGRLPLTRGHSAVEIPPIINCSILQLSARRYRDGIRWKINCVNDAVHLGELVTERDSG
jgi:2,3-bisphosphoglycerate-dependent phosphoglycerate mutase